MASRICEWQDLTFAVNLNVHISRCVCNNSERFLGLVDEDLCKECPHMMPINGTDQLAISMMDDVYGIEPEGRADTLIETLFSTHCAGCPYYDKTDHMCKKMLCDFAVQLKTLMKNPDTRCPLELW